MVEYALLARHNPHYWAMVLGSLFSRYLQTDFSISNNGNRILLQIYHFPLPLPKIPKKMGGEERLKNTCCFRSALCLCETLCAGLMAIISLIPKMTFSPPQPRIAFQADPSIAWIQAIIRHTYVCTNLWTCKFIFVYIWIYTFFFLWENEKMGNKLKIYLKDKKLKVFCLSYHPFPLVHFRKFKISNRNKGKTNGCGGGVV